MKSRSLLVALTLLASVQLGQAQCPTQCPTLARQATPDTLITLTEDELVAGLRAIAEAYRTKGHTQRQSELTAEHLRLLKLQMLLNALGLGALPPERPVYIAPGAQPSQPEVRPSRSEARPARSKGQARPQAAPQRQPQSPEVFYIQPYEPQRRTAPVASYSEATDARLDRLEQAIQLLLQSHQEEPSTRSTHTSTTIHTSRPSKTATDAQLDRLEQAIQLLLQSRQEEPSTRNTHTSTTIHTSRPSKTERIVERTAIVQKEQNDSLLYRLQQEISSLRAALNEAKAQPTPAQTQPTPAEAVKALPPVTPVMPVTPLTPLTPAQPIVRTDTIVEIVEQPENPNMLQRWQVFFEVGQSKLSAESQQTLDRAIQALNYRTTTKITLTGYASPEGNADRNDLLSLRRSRAVRTYLLNHGITPDRIESVAGGVDHQAEERVSARRVDLVLREK